MTKYLCRAAWYLGETQGICEAVHRRLGQGWDWDHAHRDCGWVKITPLKTKENE